MEILDQLHSFSLWNNSGYDYAVALTIFIGGLVLLKLIQIIIVSRLKKLAEKTKNDFDDVLISIITHVKPPFYFFIALYVGIRSLSVTEFVSDIIDILFIIAVTYEVIRAFQQFIDYFVKKYMERQGKSEEDIAEEPMVRSLQAIVKILLWIFGILAILSNVGVNVTSIIASLGIGGLAIALALQKILEDLFSSFSIYFDKPFEVGDFIKIGEDSGTVEKIGLKTSRLRTLTGEQLVMSNTELTNARVQNFKRLDERQVKFTIGIDYGTSATKLKKIPTLIKKIIKLRDRNRFDRVHLIGFGDSSIDYEISYYVKSQDYADYMNEQQIVNLEIYKAFAEEKIEFAYPTQTLFIEKSNE